MSLLINIRQVENGTVHLKGELSCEEMEWDTRDEMIRVTRALQYDLVAQNMDHGILVQGRIHQPLDCDCVRCLKSFTHNVQEDSWSCLLELEGEDPAVVVNDCVDLTPYIRDDIFLAFPQHPLCSPQCDGLAALPAAESAGREPATATAVWDELDKLKL